MLEGIKPFSVAFRDLEHSLKPLLKFGLNFERVNGYQGYTIAIQFLSHSPPVFLVTNNSDLMRSYGFCLL